MTELDIEKERREFEAWYEADALPTESDWFKKDDGGDYFHAATYSAWSAWLAAKRAVLGSAEPVHFFRKVGEQVWIECSEGGNPRDVLRGSFEYRTLYTAPPAPVSAEPVKHVSAEDYLRSRYGAYRGHHAWRELEQAFNAGAASSPPSTDAKDAGRYRWLRDSEWEMFTDSWLNIHDLYGTEVKDMDVAIDAAIAAKEPK